MFFNLYWEMGEWIVQWMKLTSFILIQKFIQLSRIVRSSSETVKRLRMYSKGEYIVIYYFESSNYSRKMFFSHDCPRGTFGILETKLSFLLATNNFFLSQHEQIHKTITYEICHLNIFTRDAEFFSCDLITNAISRGVEIRVIFFPGSKFGQQQLGFFCSDQKAKHS